MRYQLYTSRYYSCYACHIDSNVIRFTDELKQSLVELSMENVGMKIYLFSCKPSVSSIPQYTVIPVLLVEKNHAHCRRGPGLRLMEQHCFYLVSIQFTAISNMLSGCFFASYLFQSTYRHLFLKTFRLCSLEFFCILCLSLQMIMKIKYDSYSVS